MAVVRKIADRVYVMKEGEIVEAGYAGKLFSSPNHAYTKTLLEASSVGLPRPINKESKKVIKLWIIAMEKFLDLEMVIRDFIQPLLVFIFEGIRDAFDPRKTFR